MPKSLVAVISAAAILLTAPAGNGAEPTPRLYATVASAKVIKLTTASGRVVSIVRRGPYVIIVRDRSPNANFRLIGRANAANRSTGLRFVGSAKWVVFLDPGAYSYRSDGAQAIVRHFMVK